MKTAKVLVYICLVISLVIMAGCKTTENSMEAGNAMDDNPVTASMLQGNPGGVWFMLSTGISESLEKKYPGSVIHITPGSGVPNTLRIGENMADFALTHSNVAHEAVNGIGLFEQKLENVTGVAIFYPSALQFALKKDIGANSFVEIIENKIPINLSIGLADSSSSIVFEKLLGFYNLTLQDMEGWGCRIYLNGVSDSFDLFNQGSIDGFVMTASAPTPNITNGSSNSDLVLVEIEKEALDTICNTFGYKHFTITSDKYNFLEKDFETISMSTMLVASAKTSEEIVYKVTKALNENLEYIRSLHASLSRITSESMVMDMSIPLHPGAEKYYREIGLID